MPDSYTLKKVTDVEDQAPGFGVGEAMEARFATEDYDAVDTGFSHHRIMPGKRQPFGHVHEEAEEVAIVIRGAGRVKLDDEIVDLVELDAIRISPTVKRCFEAGDDGIEFIVFGARHKGDGEIIPNWWSD